MTDYYKTALEMLAQIMKEENYDNWVNWLQEDIGLWETNKSVEHHLHAYGGMGSFNDVVIGGNDNEGIWKGNVFGNLQTLTYSLAKGDSLESILEGISNRNNSNEISGWRCRNCGDARMTQRDINLFIANYFIPTFFVQFVQENRLKQVFDILKLIDSEEVMNKKGQIKALIQSANVMLNPDNNWLWNCPKCGSSEVCAYRWKVLEDGSKLVEGDDNLEIKLALS
jgi:predicted RNA-binding Zn-ribbon protein involved in translation (DUF1610 family)